MLRVRWQWLVLPMAVSFLAFLVPAIGLLIVMSFHPSTGMASLGSAWTLKNYVTVFSNPVYSRALLRTLGMAGLTVVGTVVVALPLTYVIVRQRSRFVFAVFALLYVSSLTSVVIRGLGWITLLGTNGPIDRLETLFFGHEVVHLLGNVYGVSIGMVQYMLPFMVLTLIPVLQEVNPAMEEAAAGMGASFGRTLVSVILPLTAPGLLAGSLLVFAIAQGAFVIPSMIGGATTFFMTSLIYQSMLSTFNWAMATALASVLFFLILALVTIMLSYFRKGTYQTST